LKIEYVKGENNEVPDCMSRYSYPAGLLDVSMHGNIDDDHEMQEIIQKELSEERQCVCISLGSLPMLHCHNTDMNASLNVDLANAEPTVPRMVKCVSVSIFQSRRGKKGHYEKSSSKRRVRSFLSVPAKEGKISRVCVPNPLSTGRKSDVQWLYCLTDRDVNVVTRGGAETRPMFKSKPPVVANLKPRAVKAAIPKSNVSGGVVPPVIPEAAQSVLDADWDIMYQNCPSMQIWWAAAHEKGSEWPQDVQIRDGKLYWRGLLCVPSGLSMLW
jgi:hypothetical protein